MKKYVKNFVFFRGIFNILSNNTVKKLNGWWIMDNIRENLEKTEYKLLSSKACKSADSKGRKIPEEKCTVRTEFQRDRDRIIHSKAFRRLKHKTQVFISPESDHYRTRLTHTLEVSQISRTVARALRLNEDLTEAIALGHDLGHTPYGHAGERALDQLIPGGFRHFDQSVRVCEYLEKDFRGLNLTAEVLNGIAAHTRGELPYTLEGQIVRVCDKVAYIIHDIDDACRAGIISEEDIPIEIRDYFGYTKAKRINTMVLSLINNSDDIIGFDPQTQENFDKLHEFLFSRVYFNPVAKGEEDKIDTLIGQLYSYIISHPEVFYNEYKIDIERDGLQRAAGDYIAGMTDQYLVAIYEKFFVPRSWQGN